ncbi:MAG: amidohydrolase, partial [Deferribacteraceae bacterium]|nr:amidohydrolase [Deferribacteraceae bacterium]
DYAETAFEEYKSVELLLGILKERGFTIEKNTGNIETAFTATFGKGEPVIGILAEYDALSGMSQKAGTDKHEALHQNGNGHGCGHNLFAGATLGAALALAKYIADNNIAGTVKLFGCPGEEGGSGKAFMAREKAFDNLDVALTWHPMAVNGIFDNSMLANYQVLYKFKGLASHAAASPHKGRSALDAVELMNVGVNFLREHVIQEARIHYAITNSGGFSPNVVQASADVLYLIRAPQTPQVDEIYHRVNKIAQGAAMMTETEVEIDFIKACANVVPNKTLSKILYNNFLEHKLPEYTAEEQAFAASMAATVSAATPDVERYLGSHPEAMREYGTKLQGKALCDVIFPFFENAPDVLLAGSSDVGDASWSVPTAQIMTACYAMGTPDHSWQLVSQGRTSIAHKGMLLAAKVLASAAVDILHTPDVITKAKAELQARLGGMQYKSAIPANVKPRPISKL